MTRIRQSIRIAVLLGGWLAVQSAIHAQEAEAEPAVPSLPLVIESDAAVDALLAAAPRSPAEAFRIVLVLVDLKRGDAAVPLVQQLLGQQLEPDVCAAIVRRHGSAALLRIAADQHLGDDGRKLADAVLTGANAYLNDPQRLEALIRRLGDPSPVERQLAAAYLAELGENAAAAMIGVLADPARQNEHAGIRAGLVRMGDVAVEPLIAPLGSADPTLQVQAVAVLAQMGANRTTLHLLGPLYDPQSSDELRAAALAALERLTGAAPTRGGAKQMLRFEAEGRLDGNLVLAASASNDQRTLWHWDADQQMPVSRSYHREDAAAVIAARLARDLVAVDPADAESARLMHMAVLQEMKLTGGLDAAIAPDAPQSAELLAALDAAGIDDLLGRAMQAGRIPAAIGVAEVLGAAQDAEFLSGRQGRPAALVEAARHPDRRLRWAAVRSIARLRRAAPYSGSSHVADAVAWFASSTGRERVIVADPRLREASTLAGLLSGMNLEVAIATTGRGLHQMAADSPDVVFLWIDTTIGHPTVDQLLQQIRLDPRTAQLPVALLLSAGTDAQARRLAERDPLTIAFPAPGDHDMARHLAERLLAVQGRHPLAADVRFAQAAGALGLVTELMNQAPGVYDWSRHEARLVRGLWVPQLATGAAAVMGRIGSAGAQRVLADTASDPALTLPLREAAVGALANSFSRYGLRLTNAEVLRQYARYNASRDLDEATQQLLGSILDVIEEQLARQ